jgi:heme-degrading monooxygenase HmoA
MICRTWHGYTTPENADAYERVVRSVVIPEIEARAIPGFLAIDLVRRRVVNEVEFMTIMWFESEDAIIAFVGKDATVSHVPPQAREVLARFDERAQHYVVLDRRHQTWG